MPAPHPVNRVVFSEAARADRREITDYTVERFGIGQGRRLRANFARAVESLAATPRIGSLREALDPPGRTFRYFMVMKRFVIVYQPTATGIRIARILHGMRNLAAELDRDAGDEGRGS
ncbi:MAG: type II toxin-antitoxin system RelE/ParE family toxin [Acidobacteria bacterium]|nr:type II toxin-antitoxin system RelE/ParE family toxin [Acidobacteriota bacterium]MYF13732.1 type II toxin-antitoxin system RelE/ParE family toxin [Acidobacteriota bacterium]MYI95642.1 type II toxin-antitoxin system RelE/ParE family toxin [Acidobacteriota bacterium]